MAFGGHHVKAAPDRRGPGQRALEGLGHVVGVHVVQDAQAVVGQRQRPAGGQGRPGVGSRLPAGVMTGQPGPLMWPGCSTMDGTPPASVSRCSSASICALPVPYSP